MNELCHTWICNVDCTYQSCHSHERGTSRVKTSHVTHTDEFCHAQNYTHTQTQSLTYIQEQTDARAHNFPLICTRSHFDTNVSWDWTFSLSTLDERTHESRHRNLWAMTCMDQSLHACKRVMSHNINICPLERSSTTLLHERVMAHVRMGYVTHVDEPWHTFEDLSFGEEFNSTVEASFEVSATEWWKSSSSVEKKRNDTSMCLTHVYAWHERDMTHSRRWHDSLMRVYAADTTKPWVRMQHWKYLIISLHNSCHAYESDISDRSAWLHSTRKWVKSGRRIVKGEKEGKER